MTEQTQDGTVEAEQLTKEEFETLDINNDGVINKSEAGVVKRKKSTKKKNTQAVEQAEDIVPTEDVTLTSAAELVEDIDTAVVENTSQKDSTTSDLVKAAKERRKGLSMTAIQRWRRLGRR